MGTPLEIQHQRANTSSAALSHIMGCSSANLQQRERHTQSTHSGPTWKPRAWDAHLLPHAFKPSTGMQYQTRALFPGEVTGELDWQRNKVVKSWGSVFQPYSKVDTNTRYLHTCTYTHRQRHTGTHTYRVIWPWSHQWASIQVGLLLSKYTLYHSSNGT